MSSSSRFLARHLRRWLAASKERAESLFEAAVRGTGLGRRAPRGWLECAALAAVAGFELGGGLCYRERSVLCVVLEKMSKVSDAVKGATRLPSPAPNLGVSAPALSPPASCSSGCLPRALRCRSSHSVRLQDVDLLPIPRRVRRNALSAERREAARRELQRQRRESRLPNSFAASGAH